MVRSVMMLMLACGLGLSGVEEGPRPLKVLARATSGAHHAGEAITVVVEVSGAPGPMSIEPPSMPDAGVFRLARREPGPDEAGTGASRFVVVPRRSGALIVPPFRARAGSLAGVSAPIRLVIDPVPASGRPSSFLGGVGNFSIHAEAEPHSLRAGQTLEYRLRIEGPAAWGTIRPPDLKPWAAKIPDVRVEPMATEGPGSTDPPARTFRYRLRMTRAGEWTLPPVGVSAFDPKAHTYLTRYAPGVPIRVAEPPRLDPAGIIDHSGRATSGLSGPRPRVGLGAILTFAGLAVGVAFVSVWIGRRHRSAGDDPRRFARRLIEQLDPNWEADEAARRIAGGLAEYLRRRCGRIAGELTPTEFHDELARLSDDPSLPERGRRLVEDCDRARFDACPASGLGLVMEARVFLEELAKIGGGKEGRKPREAAETA